MRQWIEYQTDIEDAQRCLHVHIGKEQVQFYVGTGQVRASFSHNEAIDICE